MEQIKCIDFEKSLDWSNESVIYVNEDKGKAKVTLSLRNLPKNCSECAFYNRNVQYDEEAYFGSGYSNSCPFGASYFGCLVERPKDCPLVPVKNLKKDKFIV